MKKNYEVLDADTITIIESSFKLGVSPKEITDEVVADIKRTGQLPMFIRSVYQGLGVKGGCTKEYWEEIYRTKAYGEDFEYHMEDFDYHPEDWKKYSNKK